MGDNPVYVHGLLENEVSPSEIIDTFADLTSASVEGDDGPLYPYEVRTDGEYIENRTANLDDVKRVFSDFGNGVLYRSCGELTIRIGYNMDERHIPPAPVYTIGVNAAAFLPDEENELFETDVEDRITNIIDLVIQSYLRLQPLYVYGYGATPDYGYVSVPDRDAIENGDLPELYWLAVYSPALVSQIGRDRLLSAPAWRTERLDDGAVLIVVYQNPRIPGDQYLPGEVETHIRET